MIATMIKIERNAKMTAAIERCRKAHPKVRRIDSNTVIVSGRRDKYTVKVVEPREGLMLAECNCEAGRKGLVCYHIAAALAAPATPKASPSAERDKAILVKRQGNAMIIDGWAV